MNYHGQPSPLNNLNIQPIKTEAVPPRKLSSGSSSVDLKDNQIGAGLHSDDDLSKDTLSVVGREEAKSPPLEIGFGDLMEDSGRSRKSTQRERLSIMNN